MGAHGPLRVEVEGGVARVVIDHPPLQLVDGALIGGLVGALDELEAIPGLRVAVVRSADPDVFLLHGDVELLAGVVPPAGPPPTAPNPAAATFERLRRAPFLTVGVLDGMARGGGCELLAALDLRLGSPRAVIGQPEAAMGILPGAGGTVRWARRVGRARALELILTGRDVGADEALALGWLDELVPADELDARADELARAVARLDPEVVAAVKAVVDATLGDLGPALTAESQALHHLMARGAHVEPMRRFLAAGGQTREGEAGGIGPLLDAMLGPIGPPDPDLTAP